MKNAIIFLGLLGLVCSVAHAQGIHRLGVGLGVMSGKYTEPRTYYSHAREIAMDGPLMEAPAYSYTFDSGLTLAVQRTTMKLDGKEVGATPWQATLHYEAEILTFGIGYAKPASERVSFVPTFVRGNGSAEFYFEGVGSSSPTYEESVTITGVEIPIYYDINDRLFLGFKPSLYNGGSHIEYRASSHDQADIDLERGFQFLIGAIF